MQKIILTIILSAIVQLGIAQGHSIKVNGNFQNATFEEFVESIESQTNTQFFFQPELVKGVYINGQYNDEDLEIVLKQNFKAYKLRFYIDEGGRVYIFQGAIIADKLPNYRSSSTRNNNNNPQQTKELTSAEKKYIEGQKEAETEVLIVGSKSQSVKGRANRIRGRIYDKATGEPLIGATVYISQISEGAATDLDGYFNLTLNAGKYLMEVSSLSMKDEQYYLQVYSDGSISIPLEKELMNINEVRVVAARDDNVSGMQMGYERISTKSIKEIPAVMGEKDVLKVAQMLPGVQSAGEGSSGIIVRGGNADQNLFYINKLPVYNTAHVFGFFSAFNPDIINSFSLYKSNIPAKYGGRISSVFDISTRQGNKKEFFGKGGISPITGHIAVEGPIVKDKSSFVFSYRGTYSDWILRQIDDINIQNSNASFYDISGTINTELNEKNLLKVFGYKSYDQFSLAASDDYNYSNSGASVAWKHIFNSSLNVDVSAIISQYDFNHNNKSNPSEAYNHRYVLNHNEVKADFLYLTGKNHRISFGYSGIYYNLNRGNIVPFNSESRRIPVELGAEKAFENALYISDEFSLTNRLTLLAGLRYSYYTLVGPAEVNKYYENSPKNKNNISEVTSYGKNQPIKSYSSPEPRIALNYRLGENNSLKGSYNRLKQYIFMLSNTVAVSPTDQWKLADYHLSPPVADQASLGYYHNFPSKGIVTSFEVYRKWINDVVEYKDGADFISSDPIEMSLLQGKQDSYGTEVMIKKTKGKLTGWMSYTYSKSEVLVNNSIPGEQINLGKKYPSNFDKPHSANLVASYRSSRRVSFSGVVVYSTGRPITYPVALYYSGNKQVLHYSGRNEYRIPDYFRVDLSLTYEGNLKKEKWLHSTWMFNIYNVTGRKNAYSVYFEAQDGKIQGYKLSIFAQPIFTVSWNFKFGNYVSE